MDVKTVGLIGAHRVGKTTLAKTFAERYPKFEFIPTNSGNVFEKHGLQANNVPEEKRIEIQNEILKSAVFKLSTSKSKKLITDRSPLDMAAYTLSDCHKNTKIDYDDLQIYIDTCILFTNKVFTDLVLIEPSIDVVEEKQKASTNKCFIEMIHYLILGLTKEVDINVHIMPHNVKSLEDRIDFLNKAIW